jgi:hypothetical protein
MKPSDLERSPWAWIGRRAGLCAFLPIDRNKPRFEQLQRLSRALASLIGQRLTGVGVGVLGDEALRVALARESLYVAWLQGLLPQPHELAEPADFGDVPTLARAEWLVGEILALPAAERSAGRFPQLLAELAASRGWQCETYVRHAGAAVPEEAVVRLSHRPKGATLRAALVGACPPQHGGACGEALGAAVAVALLQSLTEERFPVEVDAWIVLGEAAGDAPCAAGPLGRVPALPDNPLERCPALEAALSLALKSAPHLIADFSSPRICLPGEFLPAAAGLQPEPEPGQDLRRNAVCGLAWGAALLERWLALKPPTATSQARRYARGG